MNSGILPFRGGKDKLEQGTKSYIAMIERYEKKAKRACNLGDKRSEKENEEKAKKLKDKLDVKTAATKRPIGECG